jgi:GGDEF domain-containing protein
MFAARLRASERAQDLVGRLGGDEFAVILGGVSSRQDATALARAILDRLVERFTRNGNVLDCRPASASPAAVCVDRPPPRAPGALFPSHGRSGLELMNHADLSLRLKGRRAGHHNIVRPGDEDPGAAARGDDPALPRRL